MAAQKKTTTRSTSHAEEQHATTEGHPEEGGKLSEEDAHRIQSYDLPMEEEVSISPEEQDLRDTEDLKDLQELRKPEEKKAA